MELDARLLITLGGMLISVITSFIVVRQKCIELEEDSKAMQKKEKSYIVLLREWKLD